MGTLQARLVLADACSCVHVPHAHEPAGGVASATDMRCGQCPRGYGGWVYATMISFGSRGITRCVYWTGTRNLRQRRSPGTSCSVRGENVARGLSPSRDSTSTSTAGCTAGSSAYGPTAIRVSRRRGRRGRGNHSPGGHAPYLGKLGPCAWPLLPVGSKFPLAPGRFRQRLSP